MAPRRQRNTHPLLFCLLILVLLPEQAAAFIPPAAALSPRARAAARLHGEAHNEQQPSAPSTPVPHRSGESASRRALVGTSTLAASSLLLLVGSLVGPAGAAQALPGLEAQGYVDQLRQGAFDCIQLLWDVCACGVLQHTMSSRCQSHHTKPNDSHAREDDTGRVADPRVPRRTNALQGWVCPCMYIDGRVEHRESVPDNR